MSPNCSTTHGLGPIRTSGRIRYHHRPCRWRYAWLRRVAPSEIDWKRNPRRSQKRLVNERRRDAQTVATTPKQQVRESAKPATCKLHSGQHVQLHAGSRMSRLSDSKYGSHFASMTAVQTSTYGDREVAQMKYLKVFVTSMLRGFRRGEVDQLLQVRQRGRFGGPVRQHPARRTESGQRGEDRTSRCYLPAGKLRDRAPDRHEEQPGPPGSSEPCCAGSAAGRPGWRG